MKRVSVYFRRLESPSNEATIISVENAVQHVEANGRSALPATDPAANSLYSRPNNVNHSSENHIANSSNKIVSVSRPTHRDRDPVTKTNEARTGVGNKDRICLDLDKKRSQFRRSPSYTNAVSIDNDTPTEGAETPTGIGVPQQNCNMDVSPKRCPSYSHAVEHSPLLNGKEDKGDNCGKGGTTSDSSLLHPNARTKYFDGKYYVGVTNEGDDHSL